MDLCRSCNRIQGFCSNNHAGAICARTKKYAWFGLLAGLLAFSREGHSSNSPLFVWGSSWKIPMNKLCREWVLCALCCVVMPAWSQVKIVKLKDPVPLSWVNFAFSYNGKVMAANYGGEIYRWTAAGGFVDLGPGDPFNSSIGISEDSKTIVSGIMGSDGNTAPAMWQQSAG